MVIFFHTRVLQEYWALTESRIPLKPVLGGVRIVSFSISSHEQTQYNRVCCFLYCRFSLFFKDPFFQIIQIIRLCHFCPQKSIIIAFSMVGYIFYIILSKMGSKSCLEKDRSLGSYRNCLSILMLGIHYPNHYNAAIKMHDIKATACLLGYEIISTY